MRSLLLLFAAAAVACGGGTQPPPPPAAAPASGPPQHVLLVTIDTLRADHMSLHGYPRATTPFLEQLASQSVVFDRAIVQWPKTGPSFASMWTGRYPQSTGLTHQAATRVPASYTVLPELFQRLGYRTAAVVSNAVLARKLGWDHGFDEFHESWEASGSELSDDPFEYRRWVNAHRVNEIALPLLDRLASAPRSFVWIHYSDPHAPYTLPEGVENPFVGDAWDVGEAVVELPSPRGKAIGDERSLRFYVRQYDANILVVDRAIAALVDHARSRGMLGTDDLLVVTADHGESLGEHGYHLAHGRLPYNTTAHVPLLFHAPGHLGSGRRIPDVVELTNLYPTLATLAAAPAAEVPTDLEGRSLLPWMLPQPPGPELAGQLTHAFSEAGGGHSDAHFRSVQEARWKLVFRPPRERAADQIQWELYDLEADRLETRNVAAEHPEEVRRLRKLLTEWMRVSAQASRPEDEAAGHDEETIRALKALGYL
jgi:choline-sulfatase